MVLCILCTDNLMYNFTFLFDCDVVVHFFILLVTHSCIYSLAQNIRTNPILFLFISVNDAKEGRSYCSLVWTCAHTRKHTHTQYTGQQPTEHYQLSLFQLSGLTERPFFLQEWPQQQGCVWLSRWPQPSTLHCSPDPDIWPRGTTSNPPWQLPVSWHSITCVES